MARGYSTVPEILVETNLRVYSPRTRFVC